MSYHSQPLEADDVRPFLFDTQCVFARDLDRLREVLEVCFGDVDLVPQKLPLPKKLVFPLDFFPVDNVTQMQQVRAFAEDFSAKLKVPLEDISLASEWLKSGRGQESGRSLESYLGDAATETFLYDFYHSFDGFRHEYRKRFGKEPYANEYTRWRWNTARTVTKEQNEQAVQRLKVYRKWLLGSVFESDTHDTYMILPISNVEPNYKDRKIEPPGKQYAYDSLYISPTIQAPEIVVPIGECTYDSRVSQREEKLPIAVSVVGNPDSTIVATLSAPISNSFASLKTLSWLGTSFLVANAATQPITHHEWVFILGRTIAGAGGGAMVAISTFVGSDLVPLRKRGVVQGINNIAMGAGAGLGGFLGGWLNEALDWRWAFLIQIPFILLGTILVGLYVRIPVKESDTSAWRRIDHGGNLVQWNHPLVLTTLPLGASLLAFFVWIEGRTAKAPIIPLKLLLNRTVASACTTYFFTYMASFGIMYYVPIYLQLLGLSPMSTGLRFIPQSAGTALGALGTGIIIRSTGKYVLINTLAHTLLVASSAMLLFLGWNTPPAYVFVALAMYGLGFGAILVTTLIVLISSVNHVF
ncbi:major facilitator superfamily domain-containing protein [Lophiotrema nucula]|uniref:Major facilitator superfamily domain-containing protein n=1 Tax=Lophiotrema nucula TaxID=690887 RepID=A0A6A5YVA4_9PLEO|nr:major facilitator superfamily domain-containing protein [Lophiotrema nucula]